MGEIESYVTWLEAAGRSPDTRRIRRIYLTSLARFCAPKSLLSLESDDLVRYLASDPAWTPATRRVITSTIRGYYRYAIRSGHLEHDPSVTLPAVRVPRGKPRPTPDSVWSAAVATTNEKVRLMLLLGGLAGLRRSEIARLHSRDIIDGRLLRITGKGGVTREIPLHPRLAELLAQVPPGYVFPGKMPGRHLSVNYVGQLTKRQLGGDWTVHSTRHRFATRAFAGNRDILAIKELLGHASLATTQIYVGVPQDALMAGVLAAG